MPQLQKQDRPTPEQINTAYKAGYMTAGDRNDKMRRLAKANLEDIVENQGILLSYFTQTIKHVQEQWDDFVKLADDYKPQKRSDIGAAANETLETFRMAGHIMLNIINTAMAPLTAFGEVNGTTAARWAKDAGASEGLAKLINITIDIGSGFAVPTAKLSQLYAKAVQKNFPEIAAAKKVVGAGKAASETEAAVTAAKVTSESEKLADETIARGLAADGIDLQGLEGFVDDAVKLIAQPIKQIAPPDDFYKALRKYHDEIKDITETRHLKDIEKEADKLGIHLDDLKTLGQGTPLSPAQIKAYLKTLDEPTSNLIDNARQVLRGDAEAGLRQDSLLRDYFSYTPKFRAAEVQAGRTVKVLDAEPRMKSITEMMAAWDPENMAKLDLPAARRTIAEDLVALADEAQKLKTLQLTAVNEVEKGTPTFWNKIREGYVGLLLMRPVTWMRNTLGNSIAATTHLAEKELAGWLSIDEAKGITKHEGYHAFLGMQAAVGEALDSFAQAYKRNGQQANSRLDFPIHQVGGAFGRAINFGNDTVLGIDRFFKTLTYNAEVYAAALRGAVRAGFEPGSQEFLDYVTRRRAMPTVDTREIAESTSLALTFQQELGAWGKSAQKFLQYGPLALYNPFMKTPMNLVKWGWNHTPGLQLFSRSLYDDILAGGTRGDMAVARLTLSNIFGQFVYGMAQQGMLTGGGPTDPQLRRSWIAEKQPYSLKVGDQWLPISNTVEPGTTPVEMIADFAEIRNQLDDPTAEQTWSAIGLTVARDILDNTWWRSMSQLVDITGAIRSGEEVGKMGAQLIMSPVIALGTGGPLGQAIERTIDPIRRETRSWIDNLKNGPGARVLGFSKDMPPIRDGYGDPVLIPQALGADWLRKNMAIGGDFLAGLNNVGSPFVHRPEETDAIKKEGSRLQAKMPMFPWSLGGKVRDDFDIRTALPGEQLPVELSPQQRDRWQVVYREILRHSELGIEPALLNKSEYKSATFAAQRELFMDYLAKARSAAKDRLIGESPELQKKSIKATAAEIMPFLQEQDRPAAQAQEAEALDLIDSISGEQRDNLLKWGDIGTGKERDEEVIRGPVRGEITKSIPELNAAAARQGLSPGQ